MSPILNIGIMFFYKILYYFFVSFRTFIEQNLKENLE